MKENIFDKNNKKWLNKILIEIQDNLHERGKQLITKTFNNHTEYIKFYPNDSINNNDSNYDEGEGETNNDDFV